MDFTIPEDIKMLVDTARAFREQELMPLERDFLMNGTLGWEKRTEIEEKGRALGFWALEVPEEDGGAGLSTLAICMIAEEMFKHPAMFEFGGSPEPALAFCNAEQKERYYLAVVRGERRSCYAFTEPDTGSDLSRIRTTAVRKGDKWVINGSKIFISHAHRSDHVILFASTDPSKGAKGITCFLVDRGTPGFTMDRTIPTMGDEWEPHELVFTDCEISDAQRLGEVNGGWEIANHQLTHGRMKIAAYQLGIAQRCLDLAVDWAKQRVAFGKPIGSRQGVQWLLADSQVELQAARLLVYHGAWLADQGGHERIPAFVAKLYCTEMAQRVTDRCLQVLGGSGYTKEIPVQSFYRQVRVWRIGHGTSEIHRWMIARDLLGAAAKD